MLGGRRYKKDYFFLDNKDNNLITEEKVILLTKEVNYPATIFNNSRKSIAILLRSRNSGIRAKVANAIRVKKEENTMENILRRKRPIPEYYDTMYMDGYEPWEIMEAVHKRMRRIVAEREAEDNSVSEVKITSVIKKR